jgi:small subunit ribosomal protein S25e
MDKDTEVKVRKDVPTFKLITTSIVSDRMKVNGSLARRIIRMLAAEGSIKPIVHSSQQLIYTRAIGEESGDEEEK